MTLRGGKSKVILKRMKALGSEAKIMRMISVTSHLMMSNGAMSRGWIFKTSTIPSFGLIHANSMASRMAFT